MIFIANIYNAKNWTNPLNWFLSPIWLAGKNNLAKICDVIVELFCGGRGKSDEFSETAAPWLKSRQVYTANPYISFQKHSYNSQCLTLRYLGLEAQGRSRCPWNSEIVHPAQPNLRGVTEGLWKRHCRQCIWLMWGLRSGRTSLVCKMSSKRPIGKGWWWALPWLLGHVYNLTSICRNNYNCDLTDGPVHAERRVAQTKKWQF